MHYLLECRNDFMWLLCMMKVTFEKCERIDFNGNRPPKPPTQVTNWSLDTNEKQKAYRKREREKERIRMNFKNQNQNQTIRENHSCKSIDEQATRNDDFWFRNDFRIISENHLQ